jgi:phage gp16-like protein
VTARQVVDDAGARRRDLAAIHVARKALGWDDGTYRDVLAVVCAGAKSSAELDHAARKRWLAHLQACQRQLSGQPAKPAPRRTAAPWSPRLKRLWAEWQRLADGGLVHDRKRPALEAWTRGETGVDRLEWLTDQQLDGLINQAKQWAKRAPSAQGGGSAT